MNSIKVDVYSEDGLHKDVYEFQAEGTTLKYKFYWFYNRSSVDHEWPDNWPNHISFTQFCIDNGWDYDEICAEDYVPDSSEYEKYDKYRDSLNPVCCKTTDGRVCGGGQTGGNLAVDKPLPLDVKERAKKMLFEVLTVE